jgi:hypothetical protein
MALIQTSHRRETGEVSVWANALTCAWGVPGRPGRSSAASGRVVVDGKARGVKLARKSGL